MFEVCRIAMFAWLLAKLFVTVRDQRATCLLAPSGGVER